MPTSEPRPVRLEDYTPPAFLVDEVDLSVDLHEEYADVRARMLIRRNPESIDAAGPLVLPGENQELLGVSLEERRLGPDEYRLDDSVLTLDQVPEQFELTVESRNRPQDNTALEGLYRSGGNFFTQCEPEGFRRITYYPDRPDVLARFTTTIEADRARFPVLLSNGNRIAEGEAGDGRHFVTWQDPFPKPSYLFALVAGDLACVEDEFATRSGRRVPLRLYVRRGDEPKGAHALRSLKKAMAWDERTFGLEYDLDLYMIVAVNDFNMGAMENKGLNLFNSQYVLASTETATDQDFENIESVVAHEYFHNWTGNRVTCRDWFQLSLKEGLTVFREHLFSSQMHSAAVHRIRNTQMIRSVQFSEDAGPTAHPVRPASYIEINNFYTPTVYEKGAEVIRMLHTLLGADGFRRGMALYIGRHDGHAVTIDDFVAAMADANGRNLDQFMRWYDQAGTPRVVAEGRYDAEARRYQLVLRQSCPATPGQPRKAPFHIPVRTALLDGRGREIPLRRVQDEQDCPGERVLELTAAEQVFQFLDVPEAPVPSLLRDFSAPVRLEAGLSEAELSFLMAHDQDPFARWEAGQQLYTRVLMERAAGDPREEPEVRDALVQAVASLLDARSLDPSLVAEALRLPGFDYLAGLAEPVRVEALDRAREWLRSGLARNLRDRFMAVLDRCGAGGPYRFDARSVARRRLRATCLSYLAAIETGREEIIHSCEVQFRTADNMTDAMTALSVLTERGDASGDRALEEFHVRWRSDPLVLDKWFAIQAVSRREDAFDRVCALLRHPDFDLGNPNRVRSLVGAFCRGNPRHFHRADGAGYRFLADRVLELSPRNPQVAARLLGPLRDWRRYEEARGVLMRAELERILESAELPRDVYEMASKSLG